MSDYIQIKSISIDMSTEEAPDNRIYAKPIEKQGDVLLCEFESANYDIEQKALKEENTKLKTENKWYSEQLHAWVDRAGDLEELLKECSISNTTLVGIMDWLRKSTIPEQRECCEKLFKNTQKLQKQLDEVLK